VRSRVAFLIAGVNKLIIPREMLAKAPGGGWALDFSSGFIKTLGAVAMLGVIGLLLPRLVDVAPVLVPLAAVGLGLVMICAAIEESRRQEFKHVLLKVTYLGHATFVAVGRFFTS